MNLRHVSIYFVEYVAYYTAVGFAPPITHHPNYRVIGVEPHPLQPTEKHSNYSNVTVGNMV
jgi:hypothetical protein